MGSDSVVSGWVLAVSIRLSALDSPLSPLYRDREGNFRMHSIVELNFVLLSVGEVTPSLWRQCRSGDIGKGTGDGSLADPLHEKGQAE